MYKIIKLILLLNTFHISVVIAESKAYCLVNKTSTTYVPVMKTRVVYQKPTGTFKFLKNGKFVRESYVDQEKQITWKLVSQCCEGYKMSKLNLCTAICAHSCPKNAQCVEPNLCHCQHGFISATSPKDGTSYCEPICANVCPENARCAAPNICECELGFYVDDNKCIARTTIAPFIELTTTNKQFKLESTIQNELSSELVNMDIETELPVFSPSEIPIDELQKIYLTTEEDSSVANDYSTSIPCAEGFEFYNGDCRRILFPSNVYDCRFKPCLGHALCLDNGTCACRPGFSLDEVELVCLAERLTTSSAASNLTMGWIIAVGVACIICALIFVIIVILRKQHGTIDIENSK